MTATGQKYAIDEAYLDFPDMSFSTSLWKLRLTNLFILATRLRYKWDAALNVINHKIDGPDGNKVKVIEIARKDIDENAPALVYFHGGAFFLTYAALHLDNAQMYAKEANCKVFMVDYRLSTKAAFPAALNDSQAAVEWAFENAASLGIDKEKIIVIGDSAGGGLAASCAQMTHDRNKTRSEKINLLAQFLLYPVCDCETKTESAKNFVDTPLWTTNNNKVMWDVYLRDSDYKKGVPGASIPEYASPIHRMDFTGLPPAYIEPTEFDPLRDEAVNYASALEAAGVDVTLVEAKAAVHGYEFVDCETTRKYRQIRMAELKKVLAG
jgi:acetyl esterase/lipase